MYYFYYQYYYLLFDISFTPRRTLIEIRVSDSFFRLSLPSVNKCYILLTIIIFFLFMLFLFLFVIFTAFLWWQNKYTYTCIQTETSKTTGTSEASPNLGGYTLFSKGSRVRSLRKHKTTAMWSLKNYFQS